MRLVIFLGWCIMFSGVFTLGFYIVYRDGVMLAIISLFMNAANGLIEILVNQSLAKYGK